MRYINKMKTKEKILDAALKLFSGKGYHETSMAEIAEEAGLGKGTLYWHFSSKDELFGETVRREGENVVKEIQNFTEECSGQSAVDILKAFFRSNLERIYNNKESIRLLTNNDGFFNNNIQEVFLKVHFAILEEVEEIINLGITSGEFRNISVRRAAVYIVGSLGGMNSIIVEEEADDIEELVEFLGEMVLTGIQKGDE